MNEQPPVNYPEMFIEKSEGVSTSEKKLIALGYNTFLQLWSYPNPYKKQSCGKELCDLLVVFEDDILVFSDKDCNYDDLCDSKIAWRRWYKRAIKKSVEQLRGAKSWIINHPNEIALDAKCQVSFPLDISITSNTRIHLIALAHGASKACKKYYRGGDGGLLIDTSIIGEMHMGSECEPFHVGIVTDKEDDFIHVFDDASYAVILQELDTIRDFIHYLDCRKKLLLSKHIIAPSENEILARHLDGLSRRDKAVLQRLTKEHYTMIVFEEGDYQGFVHSEEYKKWKAQLKRSYFWDELLKRTFLFIENGQSYFTNIENIKGQSQLFFRLASEDRDNRLVLSDAFLSFFEKTPPGFRGTRVVYNQGYSDTCYILFLMPHPLNATYEEYRSVRADMLTDYCRIAKLDFPEAVHIIGIAHETQGQEFDSEDFMYYDAAEWSEKDRVEATELKTNYQRLGLLSSRTPIQKTFFSGGRMKGRDRNKLCPCGSGKKYKKCCGRIQL